MPATLPYARTAASGGTVHVSSVSRGLACNCVCQYCEQPLVAKKGAVKEHHFAHYRDNPGCSQESWLHATAKQMLAERINAGAGIPVSWICHCRQTHCATFGIGHTAALECVIPGLNIKPDITVSRNGATAGYIEVMVTHPPDYPPDTAGAPVAILPITEPSDLHDLYDGTVAFSDWHGIPCPDPICPDCQRRASQGCIYCPYCQKHTAQGSCLDHRIKTEAWEMLAPMRRSKQPGTPLRDSDLPRLGKSVRRNARILTERGFAQSRKKPWRFCYTVPNGVIIANFPIWKCQEQTIWESYNQLPENPYEALLRDAIRRAAVHILNHQTSTGAWVPFHAPHDYDIKAPLQRWGYLYNVRYNNDWEI